MNIEAFMRLLHPTNTIQCQNAGFFNAGPGVLCYTQRRDLRGIYLKRCFVDEQLNETISISLFEHLRAARRRATKTASTARTKSVGDASAIGGDGGGPT